MKQIKENCKSMLAFRVEDKIYGLPINLMLAKSIVNLGFTCRGLLLQQHPVIGIMISAMTYEVRTINLGKMQYGWFSDNHVYAQKNWVDGSIPATIFITTDSFHVRINGNVSIQIPLNIISI